MPRLARAEVLQPNEVAILHVMTRVVRRCFLFGYDAVSGKNFDHRKTWIEDQLKSLAANFGIDLLTFAILSNHFHLVLRSRPDVVETWDDTEVARRWLMLCPIRKKLDRSPEEPNEYELNSIRNDPDRLATIRARLSDVSWWMRLLCQNIGTRANHEDGEVGKFFQARFKAVRILDEPTLLACSAYVDLNPIRAAMCETLEQSDFTSAQRRIHQFVHTESEPALPDVSSPDSMLAPLTIDEKHDAIGPCASKSRTRCSDKGFLSITTADYLELLDATARLVRADKSGATPKEIAPIFERLQLDVDDWKSCVKDFSRMFGSVAGKPQNVHQMRSLLTNRRFHLKRPKRESVSTG